MKLTKAVKAKIIDNVLEKFRFNEKVDELKRREKAWALEFIKEKMPEGFEKVAEQHPDWFLLKRVVSITGSMSVEGVMKGLRCNYGNIYLEQGIPVTYNLTERIFDAKNPLAPEAMKLLAEKEELVEKVTMYLNSCSTVKKLVETYPEIEEFLPKTESANAVMLPSESFGGMLKRFIKDE